MAIYFTQYCLPDGHKKRISIERPEEVEVKAHYLIDRGCYFEAEILTTGMVALYAYRRDDEDNELAIEVTPNAPGVGEAVDKLVNNAVEAFRKINFGVKPNG